MTHTWLKVFFLVLFLLIVAGAIAVFTGGAARLIGISDRILPGVTNGQNERDTGISIAEPCRVTLQDRFIDIQCLARSKTSMQPSSVRLSPLPELTVETVKEGIAQSQCALTPQADLMNYQTILFSNTNAAFSFRYTSTGTCAVFSLNDDRTTYSRLILGSFSLIDDKGKTTSFTRIPLDTATGEQTEKSENSEPAGPLDNAEALIRINALKNGVADATIQSISTYVRYPRATYPSLTENATLPIRIYSVNLPDSQTVDVDEDTTIIPGVYRARLSYCISEYIGGLSCPFEGWSAALFAQ